MGRVSDERFDADVAAVRHFNRFYTRQIGLIEPKHLHSSLSLPEARILYELSQQRSVSAGDLARELSIDPGQLSRTLQELQRRQLVSRKPSALDGRQIDVALTTKGRAAFAELDRRTQEFVSGFLGQLPKAARTDVVAAMQKIERALAPPSQTRPAVTLRTHQPGDIGWIVSRHGAVYAEDYGWTIAFEALVAEIAAQFLNTFDPTHERCWIAEADGNRAGTVTLVRQDDRVAKLRLLLVEPSARGLGVGRLLVNECIQFARETGYETITLWTQSILVAARGIYSSAGFRLTDERPHHSFGHDLVGETWELKL